MLRSLPAYLPAASGAGGFEVVSPGGASVPLALWRLPRRRSGKLTLCRSGGRPTFPLAEPLPEPCVRPAPPQVGVHGIIIAFADPDTGARRTATFLPEVRRGPEKVLRVVLS